MNGIQWTFYSMQRLKNVAVGVAVLVVILFVSLTWSRLASPPEPTPDVAVTTLPDTTETGLLPPSPAPDEASPTQTYGPSAPIALEAVQAFIQNDRAGFARLAQQQVVEDVSQAPAPPPGQQIVGNVRVLLPGPTRQQVEVPTTDGPLILDMVIVDGAWKVMNMEYRR